MPTARAPDSPREIASLLTVTGGPPGEMVTGGAPDDGVRTKPVGAAVTTKLPILTMGCGESMVGAGASVVAVLVGFVGVPGIALPVSWPDNGPRPDFAGVTVFAGLSGMPPMLTWPSAILELEFAEIIIFTLVGDVPAFPSDAVPPTGGTKGVVPGTAAAAVGTFMVSLPTVGEPFPGMTICPSLVWMID